MGASIVYLHGFASSPRGTKPEYFSEQAAALGVHFCAPDLNVPSFEHLTVSAGIDKTAEEVAAGPEGPVYLMGSSMGGLTALHFLDRHRNGAAQRVPSVICLAPAFEMGKVWAQSMDGDDFAYWQSTGWLPVFHHGYEEEARLHYAFYEDILKLDSYAVVLDRPMLIIHGRGDETVPVEQSERFASGRPQVELRLVESDHRLIDQVDTIWQAAVSFFGLP